MRPVSVEIIAKDTMGGAGGRGPVHPLLNLRVPVPVQRVGFFPGYGYGSTLRYPRDTRGDHCARVATELSIASDRQRRTLWTGSLFESLDPALNDAFEAYLSERGVDGALAGFVPRYALWKEQREYLEWLHGVEGFVNFKA
ncbi:mitochondrial glycoprotein [Mycena albidolilacea]|uniref:Mitochondrial glycoprotein n=1 Tax=Mycena albidolilacea TaxID=1033008 RepID=A0AAD7EB37_9AGAR|nr:mitochondrial glycoprotein [Mycena albidolilacea]